MNNPIVTMLITAAAAAMAAAPALARDGALPLRTQEAAAHGPARPPVGWLAFCGTNPLDCVTDPAEPALVRLDARTWRLLTTVNAEVNAAVAPETDEAQWGVLERWSYPDSGKGDCEDYVLEKRRLLAAAGLPRRAQRIAVVLDENGDGHAVLMVRTDRGDLILDNKRNAILPWLATGYVFVKRESQDIAGWTALGRRGGETTATAR